MTQLLPCPFCCGDAEMDTRQGYRAINGNFGSRCVIYCLKCTAEQSFCKEDWDGDRENLAIYVTELWNARAPDPMAARLAEALREAVTLVRLWHNMPIRDEALAASNWDLYQSSPEMKRINAVLRAYEESRK